MSRTTMRRFRISPLTSAGVAAFRRLVYREARRVGRDFPWRRTRDPYHILVSEVMLQQTQAPRVADFYPRFLRRFPTLKKLAQASLAEVLAAWSGLGYNRRAEALLMGAHTLVKRKMGIPETEEKLRELHGVGPYTAAAVLAFAFDKPSLVLETNIRAVLIHHFFPKRSLVADRELLPILERVLDRKSPRRWYNALMDYGSALKKKKRGLNARSAHYTPQARFTGSRRQVRGAILRVLLSDGPARRVSLQRKLSGFRAPEVLDALSALIRDGLVKLQNRKVILS